MLFGSKQEIIGKCNVMKLYPVFSLRIFFCRGGVEKESHQIVQAGLELQALAFPVMPLEDYTTILCFLSGLYFQFYGPFWGLIFAYSHKEKASLIFLM